MHVEISRIGDNRLEKMIFSKVLGIHNKKLLVLLTKTQLSAHITILVLVSQMQYNSRILR